MRKLIFGINLTIDGCCDHTKMSGSVEIHEYFTSLMRDVDLLVYGRKTYELMVPFWPDVVAGEGRRLFDSATLPQRLQLKLVESNTLKSGCVALHYIKE